MPAIFCAGFQYRIIVLQANFNWPYINEVGFTALAKMDFDGAVVRSAAWLLAYGHLNGLAQALVPGVILPRCITSGHVSSKFRLASLFFLIASVYSLVHTYSKGSLSWATWGCVLLLVHRIISSSQFLALSRRDDFYRIRSAWHRFA
ncbi:MAG: hypothetical protein U1F63_01770 [Chitinivorax sp.]